MDIFSVLTMIGGLCLFLFGMSIMGQALERRAGGSLRSLLGTLTTNKFAGFMTGCGVTAVIQSSSATTVMVVGFVNSGLMTLKQAINVIMGANVGTTITGWILSLGGVSSDNTWVRLLNPSSFTPVLALVGIIFYMFGKSSNKKDTGMILLGFATLMFGMESMSDAVSGLADVPAFQKMFILFKNPLLGVLVGLVLTAIIQSSSASVGILQALAMTGQVSYGAAIPIIMGTSIGTCVTAMLSAIGAKQEAKRAAVAHLLFNVIGAVVWLTVFWIIKLIFSPVLLDMSASLVGIAIINTAFKILSTIILLPMSSVLEKLAVRLIPDSNEESTKIELDERLLATPPLALEQCHSMAADMAVCAVKALKQSLQCLRNYSSSDAEEIRKSEALTDRYEDVLGTYLVKLSSSSMSDTDSEEAAKLLKVIGDFERISDHAVNILDSAEEMRNKRLILTLSAENDLEVMMSATEEILDLSLDSFINNNMVSAHNTEPLEQVIDDLKRKLRTRHILRMQQGECSIEMGFVWSDLLTNLERTSDHCSNIAGSVLESENHNLNLHENLRAIRSGFDSDFEEKFRDYSEKYYI